MKPIITNISVRKIGNGALSNLDGMPISCTVLTDKQTKVII